MHQPSSGCCITFTDDHLTLIYISVGHITCTMVTLAAECVHNDIITWLEDKNKKGLELKSDLQVQSRMVLSRLSDRMGLRMSSVVWCVRRHKISLHLHYA